MVFHWSLSDRSRDSKFSQISSTFLSIPLTRPLYDIEIIFTVVAIIIIIITVNTVVIIIIIIISSSSSSTSNSSFNFLSVWKYFWQISEKKYLIVFVGGILEWVWGTSDLFWIFLFLY